MSEDIECLKIREMDGWHRIPHYGSKWHIECLRKLYNLPVSVLRKKACNRKQRRAAKSKKWKV